MKIMMILAQMMNLIMIQNNILLDFIFFFLQ